MYAYIKLPQDYRTMELLENLDSRGFRFRSDVEFSVTREVRGLRISLSRVEKKAIEKGIAELLEEFKNISVNKPRSKDYYL